MCVLPPTLGAMQSTQRSVEKLAAANRRVPEASHDPLTDGPWQLQDVPVDLAIACQAFWAFRCLHLWLGDTHEIAQHAVRETVAHEWAIAWTLMLVNFVLGAARSASAGTKLQLASAIYMLCGIHAVTISSEVEELQAISYRGVALRSQVELPFVCLVLGAVWRHRRAILRQLGLAIDGRKDTTTRPDGATPRAVTIRQSSRAQSAFMFAASACALAMALVAGGLSSGAPIFRMGHGPFPLFFGAVALWLLGMAIGVVSGALRTSAIPPLYYITAVAYSASFSVVVGLLASLDELSTFIRRRSSKPYLQSVMQFVIGAVTATMPRPLGWKLRIVCFWTVGTLLVAAAITYRLDESRDFVLAFCCDRILTFMGGFGVTELAAGLLYKKTATQGCAPSD